MTETKTYTGGCHCGAVRWRVTTDLARVISCNCSICTKKGSLLTFVKTDKFTLEKGEGATTDYQFAKHNIHHRFCSTCGIHSYGTGTARDGSAMVAVNVRCIDDVDLGALTLTNFDGRSL